MVLLAFMDFSVYYLGVGVSTEIFARKNFFMFRVKITRNFDIIAHL